MHGRGAAHRAAPWRACGMGCPRGENRRADSCRSRSCPAAAVDLRADPLPVQVLELLAEAAFPVSDERRRLLQTAALPAGQHHPQSSLGQGPKRGLLLARETLHALEEVVGYLDRRFHQPTTSSSARSEEHTSELQSRVDLVCRLLLEKKKTKYKCHKIGVTTRS